MYKNAVNLVKATNEESVTKFWNQMLYDERNVTKINSKKQSEKMRKKHNLLIDVAILGRASYSRCL